MRRAGLLELSGASRNAARTITSVIALGTFAFLAAIYSKGGGYGLIPTIEGQDPTLGRPNFTNNVTDWDVRSIKDTPKGALVLVLVMKVMTTTKTLTARKMN